MNFERKYIRGVKDRDCEVVETLRKAGGTFEYDIDCSNFGDPTMLSYIYCGKVVCVPEDSDHGKLLKATCQEVFLAPIWKTPLTEDEKKLIDKVGDYIEENYGEIGAKISHEIKKLKNFCRCTECKHRSYYYGYDYCNSDSHIPPESIICEKTNKELSYEEASGKVGACCNYEPM